MRGASRLRSPSSRLSPIPPRRVRRFARALDAPRAARRRDLCLRGCRRCAHSRCSVPVGTARGRDTGQRSEQRSHRHARAERDLRSAPIEAPRASPTDRRARRIRVGDADAAHCSRPRLLRGSSGAVRRRGPSGPADRRLARGRMRQQRLPCRLEATGDGPRARSGARASGLCDAPRHRCADHSTSQTRSLGRCAGSSRRIGGAENATDGSDAHTRRVVTPPRCAAIAVGLVPARGRTRTSGEPSRSYDTVSARDGARSIQNSRGRANPHSVSADKRQTGDRGYTRRSRPTLSYTSATVRSATSDARSALVPSTRSSSALSSRSSRARARTGPNSPTTTSASAFLKSP